MLNSLLNESHKPKFWLWDLMQASRNEQLHHFKTIKSGFFEVKMYFTPTKVILLTFDNKEHLETVTHFRGPHDSLLGYESNAENALVSLCKNESQLNALSF